MPLPFIIAGTVYKIMERCSNDPSETYPLRLTFAIGLIFALSGCTATIEQSSLLPTMQEPVTPAVQVLAGYSRQDRIISLANLGDVHVARIRKSGNRATVIYSGGNGSFISNSGNRLNELASVTGADIVTFDYPGRGGTTVLKTTDALIAFGPALMAGLRQEGWIAAGPLYSYGFSLGGATASNVARTGGFAGLILEATAADIPAVARNMIPTMLKPFIRVKVSDDLKRFDYGGYAVASHTPILVIAGDADKTVSAKTARRFAADLNKVGATVTFVEVPGGHGKALSSPQGGEAVERFMGKPAD